MFARFNIFSFFCTGKACLTHKTRAQRLERQAEQDATDTEFGESIDCLLFAGITLKCQKVE